MFKRLPPVLYATAAAIKSIPIHGVDEPSTVNADSTRNLSQHYKERVTEIIHRFKEKTGCPGVVAAISCAGKVVYNAGVGYADVEHLTPACPDTLFRIASISKAVTSLLVGRYLEQDKLSLDEDVRFYYESFPRKQVNGSYAKITPRSLLNHTSGIRSYKKSDEKDAWPEYPEMLLQNQYHTSLEACELFRDDNLAHVPGEKYLYTTLGFTLLSAVLELVCTRTSPAFEGVPTSKTESTENGGTIAKHCRMNAQLNQLFKRLGMRNTQLDQADQIVPSRASQYRRDSKGLLLNTPTVNNSYKWAGGGILSTASDLLQLANHLASIYAGTSPIPHRSIIGPETLRQLWTVSACNPQSLWQPGLGWFISRRSGNPANRDSICPDRLYVGHTGGALGGTTMLLLSLPCCPDGALRSEALDRLEAGAHLPAICVVVLTNLEGVSAISELTVSLVELTTDYCLERIRPLDSYLMTTTGLQAQSLIG